MTAYHPPKCWREPGHERCAAAVLDAVLADAGIPESSLEYLASRTMLPDPEDGS